MRLDIPPVFANWARIALLALAGASFLCAGALAPAQARSRHHSKDKAAKEKAAKEESKAGSNSKEKADDAQEPADAAADKKSGKKKDAKGQKGGAKPEQVGTFGDWGAFTAQGKEKTCYALGSPKDRQPASKVKDTPGYVFISTRPGEGVRNEVAVNLGYPTKDNSSGSADIDGEDFELVTKGTNAWVKNPAKEKEFVDALKGGSKLVVKASSAKGSQITDTYSLKGLSDALAQVQQECR